MNLSISRLCRSGTFFTHKLTPKLLVKCRSKKEKKRYHSIKWLLLVVLLFAI